ncbi:MAG: hypothetical protein M1497_12040 [Nitrospirae bacterium]|nr:hypothetical protein [Nitrospirota bacterium]
MKKTKAVWSREEGRSLLKKRMKALEAKINSVLYGLSAGTLVTGHVLKICRINRSYEDLLLLFLLSQGSPVLLSTST